MILAYLLILVGVIGEVVPPSVVCCGLISQVRHVAIGLLCWGGT